MDEYVGGTYVTKFEDLAKASIKLGSCQAVSSTSFMFPLLIEGGLIELLVAGLQGKVLSQSDAVPPSTTTDWRLYHPVIGTAYSIPESIISIKHSYSVGLT